MLKYFFGAPMLLCGACVFAQNNCPFDPFVTGNELICPESSVTLSTQVYASYQWYVRPFGTTQSQAVAGATMQNFQVGYDQIPEFVAVEATLNGCTERSPEVLVDGFVFLPMTVASSGEFTIDTLGRLVICTGDTVVLEALPPYVQNFTWNNLDSVIPDSDNDTLIVTQPGNYWVSGSPAECPDYVASLGLSIEVIWGSGPGCVVSAPGADLLPLRVSPNPASDFIEIFMPQPESARLTLYDVSGVQRKSSIFFGTSLLSTGDLPAGVYFLEVFGVQTGKRTVEKVLIRF